MAVQRKIGDVNPKNPNEIWTEYKPGQFDWRRKSSVKPQGAKAMSIAQIISWAPTAKEDSLLKIVNSANTAAQLRKVAYDVLESRGYDMTTVDTSGTLDKFFKLTGANKKPSSATDDYEEEEDNTTIQTSANANVNINGQAKNDGKITEKWYLNPNDKRVKIKFDLDTKGGRIEYDKFVDSMKKKEKSYINPVEVIQDLNEQYYEFITNDEQRFMISAGGAGVGKSYGFKKICEIENKQPFGVNHKPGDADYDYFEGKNVSSPKQLSKILKDHNGKIIFFDDTDAILTRKDCASLMKKATAATDSRIIDDVDNPSNNFEFTGRIIIMTNKDLTSLARESEDTKAIISRSMMVSEIYLTVDETIEVLETRIQSMEFPQAPRLDDEEEDTKEREEVLDFIKQNKGDIDPSNFTTRTFQSMLVEKRRIEKANKARNKAAYSGGLFSSKQKDWKVAVVNILTKAQENEVLEDITENDIYKSEENNVEAVEVAKTIIKTQEVVKAEAQEFSVDFNMDIEKAENLLFG